jgi:arginyl-tRNA synthetase
MCNINEQNSKKSEKEIKETEVKIEKTENNLEEIKKGIMKNIKQNRTDLSATSEIYNNESEDFYKKNPETIINITNKEKLELVLSNADCKP